MFPESVTRSDLEAFCHPLAESQFILSVISDSHKPVAVRVHDECNSSDVFGSDICTCRPYLVHDIKN